MKTPIDLNHKTILVTGSPGFIGANLVLRLLSFMKSGTVISLDNLCSDYDAGLKEYRLNLIYEACKASPVQHVFIKADITDRKAIDDVFEQYRPSIVVHLAAQAGVRYSIDHSDTCISSNIIGFYSILEACRRYPVEHLVYASSSSVYAGNPKVPFSVADSVDHPVSLYAATKKSNELMAHSYSKLYNIPSTGLRFFTVIGKGPSRPDMAMMKFADELVHGRKIRIFNHGKMMRDFTDVDDIVEGIVRVIQGAPCKSTGEDGLPAAPYAIYNIGGGKPVNLLEFVEILQEELVRASVLPADYDFEAHRELLPMQPGDVPVTFADSSELERDYGFKPEIPLRETVRGYCEWHYRYYGPAKEGDLQFTPRL